jgi:hypothetical protein
MNMCKFSYMTIIIKQQKEKEKEEHQQHQQRQHDNNDYNNDYNNNRERVIFERKIEVVTSDLTPHFKFLMYSISEQNALIICDYLIGQNTEINPSPSYKSNISTTQIPKPAALQLI